MRPGPAQMALVVAAWAGVAFAAAAAGAPAAGRPEALQQELSLGALKALSGRELRLAAGEETRGDLYALVGKAIVDGRIDGDVFVLAEEVDIAGRLDRSLNAVAARVRVSGVVADRLRSAAGLTNVSGEVGADAVLVGGRVDLRPGAMVRGALAIYAGAATIEGLIDGPAFISAGRVELNGRIRGDVDVRCDELVLGPAAKVEGSLTYAVRAPVEIPDGVVAGAVHQRRQPPPTPSGAETAPRRARNLLDFTRGQNLLLEVYLAAVALIGGALLVLFFRPAVASALQRIDRFTELAACFGVGLVTLLVALVLGVACLCFLPLSLAIWSGLGALVYFGGLLGKMVLGQWALRPLRRRPPHPLIALTIGVTLVFLLRLMPILGSVAWFIVTVTGMGALLTQLRQAGAGVGLAAGCGLHNPPRDGPSADD